MSVSDSEAAAAFVRSFYEAFARRDGQAMSDAYAPDASFSDPVFPSLSGTEAGAMWRMLTGRSNDLDVSHSELEANGGRVTLRWDAHYTFSATGRKVHNIVRATIDVRDGKIVRHVDDFDFWRWSRLALGAPGILLGWSPIVRNKVRGQAAAALRAFQAKAPS
ncbi:MAG: nuclear transport factor 2 family protein [Polyangiaceae bacterium]